MSHEVGSHVDLTHVNKRVVQGIQKKTSFQKVTDNLLEVGTQFIFAHGKATRRIPVSFA